MYLQLALLFAVMVIALLFATGRDLDGSKKLCIQCVTVVITCFSGFRSWRYSDLMHYCFNFLQTNLPEWQIDFENRTDTVGLQLVYRFFGQLGFGFETVIFVIAAFCAVSLGVVVYRYSSSPYFSYLMYIALGNYMFTFYALKQTVASAFIMLSFIFIIEKKPIKFTALVLVAFLFHRPAILFLAAYIIANKKIDKYYFMALGSAVVAVIFFIDEIVTWFSNLYYDTMEFTVNESVGFKQTMMILIIVFAVFLRPPKDFDRVYKCTFNIMVTAAIIQSFAVYDNVFTRLADYFFQFFVIFVPLMLETGEEQALKIPEHTDEIKYTYQRYYPFFKIGISAFAVIYYAWVLSPGGEMVDDFKFAWQDSGESSLELLERLIQDGFI